MVASSKLIGAAGEHFVMSALLRQGYIAALAPEGAPNIDILLSDLNGTKLLGLQVKSRSGKGSDGGWHMRPKHESIVDDRLLYCFVDFADAGDALDHIPDVFIIPSAVVAEAIRSTHATWLRNPGKNGHVRKQNSVRRLIPDYSRICAPETTPYVRGWMDKCKSGWSLIGELISPDDAMKFEEKVE